MSGIEIAGLLLGAFPLLISALEHYRQSAEVLEDWWQIKKEYKKCKNEIKLQELSFEGNLERFLLPLVVDDDEIAALIAEPGGMRWKDPALEETLKNRLPKSYDLFIDTIHDIQSTVEGLQEELGVPRMAFQKGLDRNVDQIQTGKSRSPLRKLLQLTKKEASTGSADWSWKNWLSRTNIEYQTHRVKFTFGKATRAKLFDDFARYNKRLRELLDTNDKSTALKQSRRRMKNSAAKKSLLKLWRHAERFHDLLGQAWCCQCKHLHRVCLFLHHETNVERIEFTICFLYGPSLVNNSCPWSWKEVNARHVHQDIHANFSLAVPQSSTSQSPTPTAPLKSSLRSTNVSPPPSRPKVNWQNPPPPVVDTTDQTTRPKTITDLCSTMATCNPANDIFGLLEGDDDSYVLQQGPRTKPPGEAYQTVSLESLLNKSSGFLLDRRQRYQIAYTLASSHLQLYPSPWLHLHWSKKDIVFKIDPRDPHSIQTDQPCMLRAVATPTPTSTPSYASSDRCLPTLGILLIELCFGTALEDHHMRQQYQSSAGPQPAAPDLAATLDLAVALEWSRSVGGEAGEMYAEAVSWCLRGRIAGARDDRWREELFANVVRPLQSCHEQLHPMGREDSLQPAPVG